MNDELVECLLYPCWRGIAESYKVKYARSIWQQFEDNIRSAAYTSSLARFYDALVKRLGIEMRKDDVAPVARLLASGNDRAVLKALRDETTMLVLMVRVKNDERKEKLQQ
jgi:hypothetical protein